MFTRFDTMSECEGQKNGHTDGRRSNCIALHADARQNSSRKMLQVFHFTITAHGIYDFVNTRKLCEIIRRRQSYTMALIMPDEAHAPAKC